MQAVNGGEGITFCSLYSTSCVCVSGTGPANPCEGFNFFELHMVKMWQRAKGRLELVLKKLLLARSVHNLDQLPHYFLSVIADRT